MPPEPHLLRAASARGFGDCDEPGAVVMVRRSAIAPCVTCGLCGGILRDATTVSECLHSFCRKCIFNKFEDEDITCCPTCSTDLGCDPLEKLREDHNLICIRLMAFPVKRRKIEAISPLHPALVSQPLHLPRAREVGQSAKKTDAHFVGESMNGEAETEAAGNLGMEPTASPTKTNMYSRNTPAEEIGTFIVTIKKEKRARAAAESTLSSAVDITAEGRAALPLVASQRELHEVEVENTARTLEKVEIYIGRSQSLQAENTRLREEFENETAKMTAAVERTRILKEGMIQRESDINQSTARMLPSMEAYTDQIQALGLENARLREELENEREEKVAAFERARILEGKLETGSERLGQKTEAVQGQLFQGCWALYSEIIAQRLPFQDYQALKSKISEKNEENAILQYDIDMLEKEKTCLEYQVDYLTKSLAERTARISEKLGAYIRRSQASEAENCILRRELDNERAKSVVAFERATRISEKLDAYIRRSQASEAENSMLKRELDNERAKRVVAFDSRTLEASLRKESEIAQRIEAALSQLLSDYQDLELGISEE